MVIDESPSYHYHIVFSVTDEQNANHQQLITLTQWSYGYNVSVRKKLVVAAPVAAAAEKNVIEL